jgi:hypothetical protein
MNIGISEQNRQDGKVLPGPDVGHSDEGDQTWRDPDELYHAYKRAVVEDLGNDRNEHNINDGQYAVGNSE